MDKRAWTYLRTLVLAALLGFPVAVAAVLFQTAIHDVIHFVWDVVPEWLDWSEPAAWYVILIPGIAGVFVAVAVIGFVWYLLSSRRRARNALRTRETPREP